MADKKSFFILLEEEETSKEIAYIESHDMASNLSNSDDQHHESGKFLNLEAPAIISMQNENMDVINSETFEDEQEINDYLNENCELNLTTEKIFSRNLENTKPSENPKIITEASEIINQPNFKNKENPELTALIKALPELTIKCIEDPKEMDKRSELITEKICSRTLENTEPSENQKIITEASEIINQLNFKNKNNPELTALIRAISESQEFTIKCNEDPKEMDKRSELITEKKFSRDLENTEPFEKPKIIKDTSNIFNPLNFKNKRNPELTDLISGLSKSLDVSITEDPKEMDKRSELITEKIFSMNLENTEPSKKPKIIKDSSNIFNPLNFKNKSNPELTDLIRGLSKSLDISITEDPKEMDKRSELITEKIFSMNLENTEPSKKPKIIKDSSNIFNPLNLKNKKNPELTDLIRGLSKSLNVLIIEYPKEMDKRSESITEKIFSRNLENTAPSKKPKIIKDSSNIFNPLNLKNKKNPELTDLIRGLSKSLNVTIFEDPKEIDKSSDKPKFTKVASENYNPYKKKLIIEQPKVVETVSAGTSNTGKATHTCAENSSQTKLLKNNNLFQKVTEENVCQVCLKFKDVLQCQGKCNGFYHAECIECVFRKHVELLNIPVDLNVKSESSFDKDASSQYIPPFEIVTIKSEHPCDSIENDSSFNKDASSEIIPTVETVTTESAYTSCVPSVVMPPTVKNFPLKTEDFPNIDTNYGSCSTDTLQIAKKTPELSTQDEKENYRCEFCNFMIDPPCFICKKIITTNDENAINRRLCSGLKCGKPYHRECLKDWPVVPVTNPKEDKTNIDGFYCPHCVCHTCLSDDLHEAIGDKLVKCLRCPASYHSKSTCIPAGTEIINTSQIICPKHFRDDIDGNPMGPTTVLRTGWCFICATSVGDFIWCQTCPVGYHTNCLLPRLYDRNSFLCGFCLKGRYPLYDEVVWVKMDTTCKWWPGLTLFPGEIPISIRNGSHNPGEYVVKLYGTQRHHWVNRGRTFLFQAGDESKRREYKFKKRKNECYVKAIKEAAADYSLKKNFRLALKQGMKNKNSNCAKPRPYIKIKKNKLVGNVRPVEFDIDKMTPCDCDPNTSNPCGLDSCCLNRVLYTECNPRQCPAGSDCRNQSFERREYSPLATFRTESRGWGLKTLSPLKKGQFIIEYIGEVIDRNEYQTRLVIMEDERAEDYYFMAIDKHRMIDAGPKGNESRFINHSCQPNCEIQKWNVNNDTRIGIFAIFDIPEGSELTTQYNFMSKHMKKCMCGASNCCGYVGSKPKSVATQKVNPKKKQKPTTEEKRKSTVCQVKSKIIEKELCFICCKEGDLGTCSSCKTNFHLGCLQMTAWPEGNQWVCPRHSCDICSEHTRRFCAKCTASFCRFHSYNNIMHDREQLYYCKNHNPAKRSRRLP